MRFDAGCSVVVAAIVLSCASNQPVVPQDAISLQSDIYVQAIAPGIWRHVSHMRYPDVGYFPSKQSTQADGRGLEQSGQPWSKRVIVASGAAAA